MKILSFIFAALTSRSEDRNVPLGSVLRLSLVRSGSGELVANLQNGTIVYLNDTIPSYTVVALTMTSGGSGALRGVQFGWNDKANVRVERTAPYTLCAGNFAKCPALVVGAHTVTATVLHSNRSVVPVPYIVSFRIASGFAPPSPMLTNGPTATPLSPTPLTTTAPVVAAPEGPAVPVTVPLPLPDPPQSPPVTQTLFPTLTPVKGPILTTATPSRAPLAKEVPTSVPVAKQTALPLSLPTQAPVTVVAPTEATVTKAPMSNAPAKAPIDFSPILINSGGAAYNDTTGRLWQADRYFTGGLTFAVVNIEIAETLDDVLYSSERHGPHTYNVPVSAGAFRVVLHFSEIYHTTKGARLFDVNVEGKLLLDIDLVEFGGGTAKKALTRQISSVDVLDGFLTIQFNNNDPQIDLPQISAIEIHQLSVTTSAPILPPMDAAPVAAPRAPVAPWPTTTRDGGGETSFQPILINCAGSAYNDTTGRLWQADQFFSGGLTFISDLPIADTEDDALFNSNRYGSFSYEVPVPLGSYELVLHLSETFLTGPGQRVFNFNVEGNLLPDVDIAQLGGGQVNKATNKITSAVVTDGFLSIQLQAKSPAIDNPTIAAIEVNRIAAVPPGSAPVSAPTVQFSTILINCGGNEYTDTQSRVWNADKHFIGGNAYSNSVQGISGTADDTIYHSERWGGHNYSIPIPRGDFEVIFHFAEIYFQAEGLRVFDVIAEGKRIEDIDIFQQAGGQAFRAITREVPVTVIDGFLTLEFVENVPVADNPKVSGIEIRRIGNHYAHAVTGGPYAAVDADGDGFALVGVVASESHTHAPGQTLTTFTWREGANVIGSGEVTFLSLPVGMHDVSLTVVDSGGDLNVDVTTVEIKPKGYPEVVSLLPTTGDIAGGSNVTITGRSFSSVTEVQFGLVTLNGSDINVVDDSTIRVISPAAAFGVPVSVSVVSPLGESNGVTFTYVNASPIAFTIDKLLDVSNPTAVAFGPDGKLYVGSTNGKLGRYTLNDSYDGVISSVVADLGAENGIHGIAFDPLESADTLFPKAYIAVADIFHGEFRNSFGNAINGKIQSVSGSNLDVVTTVISALPVSELDHSVNAIYFGDNGELYIGVGSNTNGGIPGELSGSRLMRENFFSGAVLVAHLGNPLFNGFITYNSDIDGDPVTGHGPNGVEVFGSGLRNPFGVLLHSNGKVYATENGPNPGYGDMATGCGVGQQIPDAYERDELNLVTKGSYFGHPNHKRGQTDPRQCVWRGASVPTGSVDGYTAPMMKLTLSTNGMVEFESDHFNGQMRGNLILSKYTDGLFRVILSSDGESVHPASDPALSLGGDNGLAVTQAPDGSLIDARYSENSCFFFKPKEDATSEMEIKTVFPRRGGLAGGSKLSIFGVNFSGTPVVTVGGQACANVVVVRATKLECTLPGGTVGGKDVVVTIGAKSDTFANGYRYITGVP